MTQQPIITTVEQLFEARPDICEPAREWLAENGITTLAEAWDQCHRSDWMLWLDGALDLLTDRERRLIACRCVRDTPLGDGRKVWDLLADESRRSVVVAERYADGVATDEQLAAAAAAAARAADAADAATAERGAAAAAADAARAAAAAAAAAARAARAAATAAARAYALDAARAAQADLIREIAGNPWRGKEA